MLFLCINLLVLVFLECRYVLLLPTAPVKVKDEPPKEQGDKEKKCADDVPTTSTQSETARICIFEGGWVNSYLFILKL